MWQKREAEWEKERKARERLMQEVKLDMITLYHMQTRNNKSATDYF